MIRKLELSGLWNRNSYLCVCVCSFLFHCLKRKSPLQPSDVIKRRQWGADVNPETKSKQW